MSPYCVTMLLLVLASAADGQDFSLSRDGIVYDAQRGHLEIAVGLKDAQTLLPLRVTGADERNDLRSERALIDAKGSEAMVELPWPRAPLGSRIKITVKAQGDGKEADLSNNTAEVTMEDALNRSFDRFPKLTLSPKPQDLVSEPSIVFEAEDFPMKQNAPVEEAKGASGGKAVRLLDGKSRIERDVELDAGIYLFYAVAMAFRGDQDALNVSLAGHKQRGHLTGYDEWIPQDWAGMVYVKKGTYKLVAYFDEPQVLVDKVVLVKGR